MYSHTTDIPCQSELGSEDPSTNVVVYTVALRMARSTAAVLLDRAAAVAMADPLVLRLIGRLMGAAIDMRWYWL